MLRLPPKEGRLRSRFYTQLQAIEKWMEDDGSVSLQVRMPIVDWRRLWQARHQRLLTMWFNLAACLKMTPVV